MREWKYQIKTVERVGERKKKKEKRKKKRFDDKWKKIKEIEIKEER